jgi:hypothetical protein
MPGLVPGIHVFCSIKEAKTWMAGTSPAMTVRTTPHCHGMSAQFKSRHSGMRLLAQARNP